jgi:hypothetical protein
VNTFVGTSRGLQDIGWIPWLDKLSLICHMITDELMYGFYDLFFEWGWALRYPHREIVQFLGIDSEPFVIAMQEHKQGGYGNPLVAILERIVLDHKVKENAGLGEKRWVQIFTGELLKRGEHTAFKHIWEPGRDIWYRLVEGEMLLCKPEGKVFYI